MLHPFLALDQSQCPADVRPCSGLLDFNLTLVVQMGIFLVTAALLWFLVWKPLVDLITRRQEVIDAGARAAVAAEQQLHEAQQRVAQMLDEARSQAREVIDTAARQARDEAETSRLGARREADKLIAQARGQIAHQRDAARLDLRLQTEALVQAASERLVGGVVDASKLNAAVKRAAAR